MKMKIPAPLPLLLCWMHLMDSEMILLGSPQTIELNMANEAVDDMFDSCTKEMEKKIRQFKQESWETPQEDWDRASRTKKKHNEDKDLTKNHMQAIWAYTSNSYYEDFNDAVRSCRNIYGSTFQYHRFYYWLTTAIQILKKNQQNCHKVYRRVKKTFTGKKNKVVRFGSFTSTSSRTDMTYFGNETCFYINTCLGAFLKDYSTYSGEQEVPIPPYEQFKISDIKEGIGKFKDMKDCKKTFILESKEHLSNANCRLISVSAEEL
ncbi:Erythroblast NAD(P)(+)--arginine ADP-ribosyltransferase [Channa argus]|uniref:NAD(P)(+)--arginine ADP-ribosyltransferase n=1 Tax=Channa argus TaxID=215402 RepID=A0A6G1QSR8_CHAAH|nr:Erythroblast NAD(P)(+)--arginine ADP-ribosyltransferase [Channa argus]